MKKKNRIGETHGHLKIIGDAPSINRRTRYLCECDCADKTRLIVLADNLLAGRTSRCNTCAARRKARPADFYDVQFHPQPNSRMLAPFEWVEAGAVGNAKGYWLAVCRYCNKFTAVSTADLTTGRKRHCGCRSRTKPDLLKATRKCWYDMKQRCTNPRHPDYPEYGGRGIFFDPVWADFAVFHAQMGEVPKRGMHLDRKDNNGPYTFTNCEWKTPQQNANNRRKRRPSFAGASDQERAYGKRVEFSPEDVKMI